LPFPLEAMASRILKHPLPKGEPCSGLSSREVISTLKWGEQDLYGSGRVGLFGWNKEIPDRVMLPENETDTLSDWYLLGSRYYELTNHLGNVLSVITDKKKGVSSNGNTMVNRE